MHVVLYCKGKFDSSCVDTWSHIWNGMRDTLSPYGANCIGMVPESCVQQYCFDNTYEAVSAARELVSVWTDDVQVGLALVESTAVVQSVGNCLAFLGVGPKKAHQLMSIAPPGVVMATQEVVDATDQFLWTSCGTDSDSDSWMLQVKSTGGNDSPRIHPTEFTLEMVLVAEADRRDALERDQVYILDSISSKEFDLDEVVSICGEDTMLVVAMNVFSYYNLPAKSLEFHEFAKTCMRLHNDTHPFHNSLNCAKAIQFYHVIIQSILMSSMNHIPGSKQKKWIPSPVMILEGLVVLLLQSISHTGLTREYIIESNHCFKNMYPYSNDPQAHYVLTLANHLLTSVPSLNFYFPTPARSDSDESNKKEILPPAAFRQRVVKTLERVLFFKPSLPPSSLTESFVLLSLHEHWMRSEAWNMKWCSHLTLELWRQGVLERKHAVNCSSIGTDRMMRYDIAPSHLRNSIVAQEALKHCCSSMEGLQEELIANMQRNIQVWGGFGQDPTWLQQFVDRVDSLAKQIPYCNAEPNEYPSCGKQHYLNILTALLAGQNPTSTLRDSMQTTFNSDAVDEMKMYKIGKMYRGAMEHLVVLSTQLLYDIEEGLKLVVSPKITTDAARSKYFRELFFSSAHQWVELLTKYQRSYGIEVTLPLSTPTSSEENYVEVLLNFVESTKVTSIKEVKKESVSLQDLRNSSIVMMLKCWMAFYLCFQATSLLPNKQTPHIGRGITLPRTDPIKEVLDRYSTVRGVLSTSLPARRQWVQLKKSLTTPTL